MKEENKNISDLASSFEALSKVVQSNSVALAPQFANIAEVTKMIEEKTAPLKAVAEAMQGWQSSFAPHFERFDAIREVFSKKVLDEMAMMQEHIVKKYDILESDYNDFIIRLAPLWNELGVIRPRDFTQFMNWFFDCLHFDEPFYSLEIVRNDFILYGEYERCLALDRFWTDEQERERLRNKQADVHINSKTYTTKDYVMAYIIECFATDVKPPSGEKSKLEEIGKELLKPINGNGNTFYKKFNDHFLHISKTDNQYLIENWGSDWQSIVLDLAKDKEEVSNYLKNNR